MKIAIAGPIELEEFSDLFANRYALPKFGMGGQQVNRLSRELLNLGHHVSIYTLDETLKPLDVRTFCAARLKVTVVGRGSFTETGWRFRRPEARVLARLIRMDDVDIVHAHWTYEYAVAAINSTVPAVISVRDWAPTMLYRSRWRAVPYRLQKLLIQAYVIRNGDFFIANSDKIYRRLEQVAKEKTIRLVNNFVPAEYFRDEAISAEASNIRLISINNGFSKVKNVTTLLRAFAIVRERFPDVSLTLVGRDFERHGPCYKWAVKRNLSDGLRFLGRLQSADTQKELRRSYILVHPSLEESFGNTLVEAMAAKVAVVGGRDSGAVPGVLGGGEAGILVDAKCMCEMARAVIRLLSDFHEYECLVENAFRFAKMYYSAREAAVRHVALYEEAITSRP